MESHSVKKIQIDWTYTEKRRNTKDYHRKKISQQKPVGKSINQITNKTGSNTYEEKKTSESEKWKASTKFMDCRS